MNILPIGAGGMNILPIEAGGMNIIALWSGRYEHFARFWRQGTIDCMPLYAQAYNATFSARLDTKYILWLIYEKSSILYVTLIYYILLD